MSKLRWLWQRTHNNNKKGEVPTTEEFAVVLNCEMRKKMIDYCPNGLFSNGTDPPYALAPGTFHYGIPHLK